VKRSYLLALVWRVGQTLRQEQQIRHRGPRGLAPLRAAWKCDEPDLLSCDDAGC
jgi:hypothetical protein